MNLSFTIKTALMATILLALGSTVAHAERMRFISLNLWLSGTQRVNYTTGVSSQDRAASMAAIERILAVATGGYPTVIGLQEVDNGTARSDGEDVTQRIEDYLGTAWSSSYLNLMPSGGGSYGNAVLSNLTASRTQFYEFAFDPNNPAEYGKEQ